MMMDLINSISAQSQTNTEGSSLLDTVDSMMSESCFELGSSKSLVEIQIVENYLAEPNIPIHNSCRSTKTIKERNDPLNYWRVNENSKPIMCKCAQSYLCAPSGSVASERLFSTAGDIADGKRIRMLSKKVEMLLLLRKTWNCLILNINFNNFFLL